MKKTLSVFLAVCMIFMFVPFFAFAEDAVTVDQAYLEANNYSLPSGVSERISYIVTTGTITIPAGRTLHVSGNTKFTVGSNANLVLNGDAVVHENGEMYIDGGVTNADNITINGICRAKIVFPSLNACGLAGKIEVSYASSYSGSEYDELVPGSLTWYTVDCNYEAVEKYIDINQYVYIVAHIIEPVAGRDQFDDSLMKVRLNGVEIPYKQGSHCTLLTCGGTISYSQWTNDNDFLNTYKIDLPNKEGVTVVGRGGEVGSTDTVVYVKYGKPFSFRVDLDDSYSKSPIEVYIVSGYGWTNMDTSTILADLEPAQPDADGYYTIPSVQSDYTVFVMGVIANETVEKVGGIFEQVKSIFEMIKKFFSQFLAMFGLNA